MWSHVSAGICRLLQSLYASDEAALQTYSDDPLLALSGSTAKHDLHACVLVAALLVLGLRLSFHK